MIKGLTSINELLSKIVRDLALGDAEIRYQDMIEWIAEGLKHIGAYTQFVNKEAIIPIINYKGELPCDYHILIEFQEAIDCSSNTRSRTAIVNDILNAAGVQDAEGEAIDSATFQKLQLATYTQSVDYYPYFYSRLFSNNDLVGQYNINTHHGILDKDFRVEFNAVRTTFKDGFLVLKYQAFPVDCDGLPLIPDNVSYFDALFWKVAYHMCLTGREFKRRELNSLDYCKQQWNFYCMQARAEAITPSLEEMEQLKNIWTRLIPSQTEYLDHFRNNGRHEWLDFNGKN